MNQNYLRPIKVKISYDDTLKEITGKNEEIAWVNEGMLFAILLSMVFSSYPEIKKRYPPGKLGLLLNNRRPQDFDILNDGDEIVLKTT